VKECPVTPAGQEPPHGYELVQFFSLVMPDDTVLSPSGSGSLADNELATQDAVIAPGQCVIGVIVFGTPTGEQPEFVQFASSSIIQWRVP
jgi:hypothetical protein